MNKIYLLDCTLRDGGYVNNWNFGNAAIKGFLNKIVKTGIEIVEVGFIKGDSYDADKSLFPDIQSISEIIKPKSDKMLYVGMLDMQAPIPIERLIPRSKDTIDGIRVIFKKDKIDLAYKYCEKLQELGYFVSVNFVGTDLYTDNEFIEGIEKFNKLHPFAVSIVDTFGVIKRKQFLRLCNIANDNLADGIALAYHAHNNLQQAFGNAEALVDLNLNRDLIIDACVFGMGRGAGNLNLELFAEYMNENYGTHYKIEPMLEIMDEYLNDIYRTKFWGYSLPLYISATTACHPNYAIYLAEKDSLTVKAFNELLSGIPKEDKSVYSKEKAEYYYRKYQENYIDDKAAIDALARELCDKNILILAPGSSLKQYETEVKSFIKEKNAVVIASNFLAENFEPDFVFSSNMRRFSKMQDNTNAKVIITSNMKECEHFDYKVNYSSYISKQPKIIDNSVLMLLKLLVSVGVKGVGLAGMDGYNTYEQSNYYDKKLEYDFSKETSERNALISEELAKLKSQIKMNFITPTYYSF